jgi:arylsulfatase A-like enzyme
MRKILTLFALLTVLGLHAQKPNIILIISDDQSFNSIGYTSGGAVYTPSIDSLAMEGMRFTNAHHPVTVCSPSRYSILTGKFSGRCRGEEYLAKFPPGTLTRTENNCELTIEEDHLGKILGRNGYTTGFVGKSHIMEHDILSTGNWSSYGLQPYGLSDDPYDPAVSAKMKHNHEVYQSIVRSYGFDYADGIYMANVKELRNDALNIHNLEWTVDKARKFIEQEKDNPFFLMFNTTLHHGPVPWARKDDVYWSSFDADPKLTGEGYVDTTWDFMPTRQQIQDLYTAEGFIERDAYTLLLDEGVRAIYRQVVDLGLEENTLIIFMPDHGMWRHGKATLHDFGLKVPMLMYWKGDHPGRCLI